MKIKQAQKGVKTEQIEQKIELISMAASARKTYIVSKCQKED